MFRSYITHILPYYSNNTYFMENSVALERKGEKQQIEGIKIGVTKFLQAYCVLNIRTFFILITIPERYCTNVN